MKKTRLKRNTGDGGHLLGEQIDEGGGEQDERDQPQSNRNLYAPDADVAGHLPFPILGQVVAQHEHGQRHEREAPDHAEGIQRGQQVDIAAAGDDGKSCRPAIMLMTR